MTDSTPTRALTTPPALAPGDQVRTPSGRVATVEAIDETRGEVTVEWPAERATFTLRWLRRAP